jgi:hypothetical protein
MTRKYHRMPPLWWVQENLELTPDHPSGLKWKTTDRYHDAGDVAGRLPSHGRFYTVSMLGMRYPAHRVVYYLRTDTDPGDADVLHDKDNIARDNRLNLSLYQRRTQVTPKYRRRVRDDDGNLVYREPTRNYNVPTYKTY